MIPQSLYYSMKSHYKKLAFIMLLFCALPGYSQEAPATKKWFIVLPLRFTHLQNNNTMLSGIKLGRTLYPRFQVCLSVYHSFYLKSFRSPANLNGFDQQPRLFINGMGGEAEYLFINSRRVTSGIQLMLGWGFMKYDLKDKDFNSKQVNYFAVEPTFHTTYKINPTTHIGLGVGYRPTLTDKQISYTSNIGNGEIPISKTLPNGLQLAVTLTGFL
jgi:hypothetical protein